MTSLLVGKYSHFVHAFMFMRIVAKIVRPVCYVVVPKTTNTQVATGISGTA